MISWALQRGTSAIPKAANPEHMKENQKIIKLSAADMETISTITTRGGERNVEPVRFLDPRSYIGFDIFDEEVDQPAL